MSRKSKRSRPEDKRIFRSRFNLGKITAETDSLLSESFFPSPDYETMESRESPSAFVVGRTGAGKSAAFRYLAETQPERVIFIRPEHLALPYIANNDIVRRLDAEGYNLEPFFRPLWQRVIVSEIIHHRYQGKSAQAREQFIDRIKRFFSEDPVKRRALKHLDELTEDFWCTTEERVQRTIESLSETLHNEGGFNAKLRAQLGPAQASFGTSTMSKEGVQHVLEVTTEQRDRTQRIVNQSELTKLREILDIIRHHVLDTPQQFTYVLIDDLDRYLVEEPLRAKLLRCLFEAVIDMQSQIPYLKILVALRTNIFRQLDYGSQRYGMQEEKAEDLILPLRWTKSDLAALLNQRVQVGSSKSGINPPLTLSDILPNPNKSRDPLEFIFSRTLMRPRDCILFLNTAIEQAEGRLKLSWDHLRSAEQEYSGKRLKALREEWKDPFFHVDRVLEVFRKKPAVMDWDEIKPILDSIALDVLHDPDFHGRDWLTPLCSPIWDSSDGADPCDIYMPLIQVLFEIGFLGIGVGSGGSRRLATYCYHLSEPIDEDDLGPDVRFEVHPAFRSALRMSHPWVDSQ